MSTNLLDDLHAAFLDSPPKAAAAHKALRDYQRTLCDLQRLNEECLAAQKAIVALGAKRAAKKAKLDELAKNLIRSFGRGPLVIGKVTHDFGATKDRVYLIPRKGRAK